MLKIYGFPRTRAMRATWTAEEAGVDYELVKVDMTVGAHRQAPFIDINPAGKVPALVDGALILTESAAICTYIGERGTCPNLVPAPLTQERALYDQWCFFTMAELEQPLWTLTKHQMMLPKAKRVPAIEETARWEFGAAADLLTRGLGDKPYILGDTFTVADVLIGLTLGWARLHKLLEGRAPLESYRKRLTARPAFAGAIARERALLHP